MEPTLKIKIDEANYDKNYQLISFEGDFDKAGHSEIQKELEKAVEEFELKSLVFNVTKMKFINSEGIGYMTDLHAQLAKKNRQLVVVGPNSHVADVFETIGFNSVVKVHPTLDSFLKAK